MPRVLAFAAALLVTATVQAAPVVTVKGRAAIDLDPVHLGYEGAVVRGRLLDRATREPITFAPLEVRLDYDRRVTSTDADGRFRVTFDVRAGTHDLEVVFDGDSHHTSATFEMLGFDVRKEPLKVSITTPERVAWSQGSVEVVVRASTPSGGTRVPLEIRGGSEGDDPARLGRVTTDDTGRGTLQVELARLGGPGPKRLEVRFTGDAAFNETSADVDLLVTTASVIELRIVDTEPRFEDRLVSRGAVSDDTGDGIPRAPVALVADTRRLAETLADERGAFELRVPASELGEGKHNVQVVYEPTQRWRMSSRSEPTTVEVAAPQPVPVSYTVAAFAATLVAMLAFLGLRARPWERWRAGAEAAAQEDEADTAGPPPPPRTGLREARPSLVSTLRRAQDRGFAGVVRDAVTGEAVGGARVTLAHTGAQPGDGTERGTESDGAGRFALEDLAAGRWDASVGAAGYCTERFPLGIPHRGELREARVDLLPVRERIFLMYREAALPLLPDPSLWGIWTPRQIFEYVRRGSAPAWGALTDFVEETYFSQRTPDESVLPEAAERVDAARQEAPGRRPGSAPGPS